MATVSSTTPTGGVYDTINANNSSSSTTSSTAADTQDRFLTLLVTQLQNQDPLNPMDNSELTSQLAQISTVTGIEELNTTLSSLVNNLGTNQSLQASGLIGKSVLVPGTQMVLTDGAAYAGVNLSSAADEVTVTISDSSGTVVHTQKLGAQEAGVFNVSWDGTTDSGTTAEDGTYKFTVTATQGGTAVSAEALQFGGVYGLIRSGSEFLLDLGELGTFSYDDVQQII